MAWVDDHIQYKSNLDETGSVVADHMLEDFGASMLCLHMHLHAHCINACVGAILVHAGYIAWEKSLLYARVKD